MASGVLTGGGRLGALASFLRWLPRFLGMVAVTLLGLLAVTFFIGRVVPIDPVLAVVGDRASPEVYERARRELGLDLPLWQQFWTYARKAVTGDFGRSVLTTNPVMTDIARVFPATLELATLGTLLGTLVGVPLGVLAAVRRGSAIDQFVRLLGLIGYSVPIFWLGLMALLLFYAKLGWVEGPGRIDIAYAYNFTDVTGSVLLDTLMQGQMDAFWNAVSHIVLPACLLGYFSLAYISRMTRSFMLNELSQEYVVAARVKGLSEARVIWRHALRNVLIPVVTVIGLYLGVLIGNSVLTEIVFNRPGLGKLIVGALNQRDYTMLQGLMVIYCFLIVVVNTATDLLYGVIDPRVKAA
jgi:peptide/nickel transport system permease protein